MMAFTSDSSSKNHNINNLDVKRALACDYVGALFYAYVRVA
jgi:hypothetical protein